MNKIVIGMLVFLVLVSGGLGAYSAILNRQIDRLGTELTAFKGETAREIASVTTEISEVRDNISTLDTELITFKGETALEIAGVASEISEVRDNISTLDMELTVFKGETALEIAGVASEISGARDNLSTLDTELTVFKGETAREIAGVTTELSQSTINVAKIYQGVRKAVCEITDGEEWFGSGFVLDSEGYIITAEHVIDGLAQIEVVLYDGTISSASVVGDAKYSDIAVLKLEKTLTLEPLELADANTVTPGEPVVTLGTPFYLSGTVTSGIVSRTNVAENYRENWLTTNLVQYDAASNSGNSGGLLVNSEGEIIGMVVGGIVPTRGSGIYWAVSSNKIKRVADAIIDSGSFEEVTLPGTWTLNDLTPEEARDKSRETTNGVLFSEAEDVEGIQADDIVVAVDEVPVREASDLFNYLGEYKSPGDTVTLTVIRGETEIEVSVELVEGWVRVD